MNKLSFSTSTIVGIFISIFMAACKQTETNLHEDDSYHIQIIPEERGETHFSDIVDSYEYIPLETNEASSVGKVAKIHISKNKIFLFDMLSANEVSVFNRNGSFDYKLNSKGRGPGEYEFLVNFTVDEEANHIFLLDNGYSIIKYDFKGNFIDESTTGIYTGMHIEKLKNGFAFIGGNQHDNLILSTNDLKEKRSFFPYQNRDIDMGILSPIHKMNKDNLLYRRHLHNTIYKIEDYRIVPHAVIDFGNLGIEYPYLVDHGVTDIMGFISDYCTIWNYLESSSHIFIDFAYKNQRWYHIVSKKTMNALTFSRKEFVNDITFERRSVMMGVDIHTQYFVYLIQPFALKGALTNGEIDDKTKASTHYKTVSTMTNSLSEDSNPVLMFVKFKDF